MSADDKILKALEGLYPKLDGVQKESVEYRIKRLKEKMSRVKEIERISVDEVVTKNEFEQKINKEKKLLDGLNKILQADVSQEKEISSKKEYIERKLALLNLIISQISDQETYSYQAISRNVNGTIRFEISEMQFDPLFKCQEIDFFIDDNLKKTVKSECLLKEEKISFDFGMENSREFEIVFKGEGEILLGLIFFSCEHFLDFKKPKTVVFSYLQSASFKAVLKFDREIKLLRKNAEIICVYKKGHALETLSTVSPIYCSVCDNIATFGDLFRCYKCKLTCHRKCANYILFFCLRATEIVKEKIVKRYAIPHEFKQEKAFGFRYCGQCGVRISLGIECKSCNNCNKRFHLDCAQYTPKSCRISFELRKTMANFNPPLPELKERKISISIKDFHLIKVLGRGAFGKVMLVSKDRTPIAIKILKKEMIINNNNIQYLELERSILKRVSDARHPFLMQMVYCFQDDTNIYFGTEFLAGGDLFHYASKFTFTHSQILLYSAEIILGLEYLHSQNIIYRDMKLDNVLICSDGHVKIADFGLCKDNVEYNMKTSTFCGTADTIAPEVILQGGYTKDVDWWSFGVVMFEMFENETPFNGSTTDEITAEILKLVPKFSERIPAIAQNLIGGLLEKKPENRLGFGKEDGALIRAHKYFDTLNWQDVRDKKIKPEFIPEQNLSANFDDEFTDEPIIITPCNSFIEYDQYFINFH